MYGDFVFDEMKSFRDQLSATLNDLKQSIDASVKAGGSHKPVVDNDGILEGPELQAAKDAARAVNKAMRTLKPVWGHNDFGDANPQAGANALGRAGPVGEPIAMYGVVLMKDLDKFTNMIGQDLQKIKDAVASGKLTGPEKEEATKAITILEGAIRELNAIEWPNVQRNVPPLKVPAAPPAKA
jgi:hypothetical protein